MLPNVCCAWNHNTKHKRMIFEKFVEQKIEIRQKVRKHQQQHHSPERSSTTNIRNRRAVSRQPHLCIRHYAFLLFLLFASFENAQTQYNPCEGKAQLGEGCEIDTDCENKGSVCLRGMCQCHPHYVRITTEKGGSRCSRLPAKIGQECSSKCREPLFCRNGRCQCVQRGSTSALNGECVFISRVGDRCSRHYDCTSPFSACVNHQCICISGTVQRGSKCVAANNCPMGGTPTVSCIRRAQLSQIANFVEDADTCPTGQHCVTMPDSQVGHCCPIFCPLSTTVDPNYTCVPGAVTANKQRASRQQTTPAPTFPPSPFAREPALFTNISAVLPILPLLKQPCPADTHFCHYLSGDTFSQAVCCKRPCNAMAPEALYLNGECVARGQLNAHCQRNEQCGAAEGMECVKGQCQCVSGFLPAVDVITHPQKNPSQHCVIDCDKKTSLSRDTTCLNFTQLGGACFVQEQCPENSGCYRGRCICRCKFRMSHSLNKCVPIPAPTTPQPQNVQPLVPGLSSGQLSQLPGGNIFNIGSIFGKFFGASDGRPPTVIQQ